MAERGDQDSGRDDAVILELAEAIGDTHWHKPEGTLYRIGDSETQFAIAHRSGRWLAESTDRGHTSKRPSSRTVPPREPGSWPSWPPRSGPVEDGHPFITATSNHVLGSCPVHLAHD